MVCFDNSIFCLALHPNAKPRSSVSRAKDRVNYLLLKLHERNERIILPTPALSEFLVFAGADAPAYLDAIRANSIFRVRPFDEQAAIELADMDLSIRARGDKRGSATDSDWQKVKFDRQIVAIAKLHNARVIYSDDPHIKAHGRDAGIPVLALEDLDLPPAVQTNMFEDQNETESAAIIAGPSQLLGSGDGLAQDQARAQSAEAKTDSEGQSKTTTAKESIAVEQKN